MSRLNIQFSVLGPADQAFVTGVIIVYKDRPVLSNQSPQLIKAMRMLAEQELLSSVVLGELFQQSKQAVISFCRRVDPPIRLFGSGKPVGGVKRELRKRKHRKGEGGDLTDAVKYTRLVNTVNTKAGVTITDDQQVTSRNTLRMHRILAFKQHQHESGVPYCSWHQCREPVVTLGKPYCHQHHAQAYGKPFFCHTVERYGK